MIDPNKFAVLIADYCLEVAAGQQILIESTTLAQAPVRALHGALLERGAWPLLRLAPPDTNSGFYRSATPELIDSFAPIELLEAEAADARVWIDAPANTNELTGIDPSLITRSSRARQPIRQARQRSRWCVTTWPTPALAQQARMSERDYEAFVQRALFLDRPDPVAAWRELSERQRRLVERLEPVAEVHIESDRTDLRLKVAGRTWINSDGRRNMPSGEVFTGPQEGSAQGTIRFDVPSNVRGADVMGVELTFEDGQVVAASADHGQELLDALLETDAGARRLGELGIGTNTGIDRATGSTLLDEKIAGTIHLALGRSYPETGGENESALHWDLICDLRGGGRVSVDGEPLLADGALVG